MTNNVHPRIRRAIVATVTGGLALPVMWAIAPLTAHAAACTQTVRGAHSGVLNVAANQTLCLRGAVRTAPSTWPQTVRCRW